MASIYVDISGWKEWIVPKEIALRIEKGTPEQKEEAWEYIYDNIECRVEYSDTSEATVEYYDD